MEAEMTYLDVLKKAAYIAVKAAVSYFAPNAASKFISTDTLISPVVKEVTHNIAGKYVEKQALDSLEFMASAIAPDVIEILTEFIAPKIMSALEPAPKAAVVAPELTLVVEQEATLAVSE